MSNLLKSRLVGHLLLGDTKLLRLWFAVASLTYPLWLILDPSYVKLHTVAVSLASIDAQVILFSLSSSAMIYGVVTGKFSRLLLFAEGLLGTFLWVTLGVAEAVKLGSPGILLLGGGGTALYLLVRYPITYKVSHEC